MIGQYTKKNLMKPTRDGLNETKSTAEKLTTNTAQHEISQSHLRKRR